MRRSRSVSHVFVVWVVIGVIVATNHHYFSDLKSLGSFLSALLAILLWPLILLGTKFTINL
jgi:ABC-type anion transport system duplicated permease subunit